MPSIVHFKKGRQPKGFWVESFDLESWVSMRNMPRKQKGNGNPGMILSTHLVNSKMISHFLGPASDSEFQTRNPRVANTGCLSNLQPIKANPIQTNDAHIQSQPPTIHTPQWKEKTTWTTATATTTKKHRTLKNAIQTGKKSLYSLLKETYGSKLPPNFTHGKLTKTTPFAKKTMDSNSGSPDLMLHGGPRHNELLPSLDPGASFLSNGDTKKSWHEPWVIPDRFRFLDSDSADGSLYALEYRLLLLQATTSGIRIVSYDDSGI